MSNEKSTTPTPDDTEGHAILKGKVGKSGNEEDTAGHVGMRISDLGTDDDTEGNKLK